MNTLAKWGMLQPLRIDVWSGSVSSCSYEERFHLPARLEYRNVFAVQIFDEECEEIVEKKCSVAYRGFDSFERFDVEETVVLALGGPIRNGQVMPKERPDSITPFDSQLISDAYEVVRNRSDLVVMGDADQDQMSYCYVAPELQRLGQEIKDGGTMESIVAPEPASSLLMLLGLAGLVLRRKV